MLRRKGITREATGALNWVHYSRRKARQVELMPQNLLVVCHGPDEINSRGNATVLREYYDGEERENAGRRVDA